MLWWSFLVILILCLDINNRCGSIALLKFISSLVFSYKCDDDYDDWYNDWWWNVCSAFIVLNLLEDTSVVSLASCIKVKATVGPHAYWWADEPALQNWVIGSVLISIWQHLPSLIFLSFIIEILKLTQRLEWKKTCGGCLLHSFGLIWKILYNLMQF